MNTAKNTIKIFALLAVLLGSAACTQTFAGNAPAEYTYNGLGGIMEESRALYNY